MISKIWLNCLRRSAIASALLAPFATLVPVTANAAVAGQVQFVSGDVRIIDTAGKARVAQKGQDINEGETVITALASSAQLRMIDGGLLALRPDTQLKVDTYVFKGTEDGSENALLSLVKGGLRTITGLIGHENKDKLKLRTPTATIGIRGTDHEPIVLVEPTAGAPAPANPPGTYDKVNVGATSLTTNVGTAVINPNQVGFAASPNQAPVLLPKLPDFYRATPSPVAHAAQHQGQAASSQSTVQSTAEPAAEASTTSASSATSSTTTATAAATTPVSQLTGVNASGETINLASQTLTTSSGQTVSLSNASSNNSGGSSSGGNTSGGTGTTSPAASGTLLVVGFPYPVSNVGAIPEYFSLGGPGLMLANDASGNLTGVSLSGDADASDGGGDFNLSGTGSKFSLNQSGSTFTNFGSNAATGISWGRWQGGTVTETSQYFGQDASGNYGIGARNSTGQFVIGDTQTQTINLGQGSLHWITAPNPYPSYLAQVLTGTANYTLIGNTNPTDQNGNVGTLNSATLGANFSTQMVNANLNFTVAGNTWGMQSGAMNLQGAAFSTYTNCSNSTSNCGNLVLTKNGVVTSNAFSASSSSGYSNGAISGFFTGNGLNGAVLEYTVQDTVLNTANGASAGFLNNAIQGIAAFSGTTQNVATPFRAVGISDGWNNIGDIVSSSSSSNTVFNYGPSYRGSVTGGEQPLSSVVDSASGLTSFLGQASGYTSANSSVSVPSAGTTGPTSVINIGTAVNTDVNSAVIDGVTVSWGRWAGGTVNIYSIDGSTLLGTIDNSNRSIHWITTSALNNTSFNLPMTGTATYTLVGNTAPTDYRGNTGTLNSVSLNADFGNAKVNTSVNVSFNAANNSSVWTLTANNVPLGSSNGGGFSSDSAQNGVNGVTNTVTCTGTSCGSVNHDYVQGHFVAGAQGAVIFYGMSTGNNAPTPGATTTTFTPINGVTGLVVMKH